MIRRMTTTLARMSLLATMMSAAPNTFAQPSAQPGVSQGSTVDPAEERFRRGNAFYKEQKFAEAEAEYEAALALKKTHDIASNLGHAELKQQKHREGAEHLALAIRMWPPTSSAEKRAYAEGALAEARKHVGMITVKVSVAGALVAMDGKPVGLSPLEGELYMDPGSHVVEATLAGYELTRQAIDAKAGSTSGVELTLKPKAETGPVVPPRTPKRSLVPAIVLGGVAVAGVAAGLGLYFGANGKLDDATELAGTIRSQNGTCKEGAQVHALCEDLASAKSTGKVLDGVAIGSFALGGLAAAGAAVYLLWPAKENRLPEKRGQVSVYPIVGAGGGVGVRGSF